MHLLLRQLQEREFLWTEIIIETKGKRDINYEEIVHFGDNADIVKDSKPCFAKFDARSNQYKS